mgnify:CR=1 FL=1
MYLKYTLMNFFIKISFIFTLIFLLGCKEKEYVKDFKVEGIAVGDSLLTYFSEEDILKNQRTKDIFGKPDDLTSLYVDSTFEDYEFETYQKIQIYYLRDDKKYIIHSVGGAIFYQTDYKACNDKFFEVKKILNEQYTTPTITEYINEKDNREGYGDTKFSEMTLDFENGESITIICNDWDNELLKVQDYFQLSVDSKEIKKFMHP